MNGLLWKEWRQNRLIMVWMTLLTLVLLIGDLALNMVNQPRQRHIIAAGEVEGVLYFLWFLSALFCSSAMMASEVGSGSLQFLSGLPISRTRLWLTKLLTCLCLLMLSVVASTAVYFGVYAVASHLGVMQSSLGVSLLDLQQTGPEMFCIALPLIAFGMAITMLVDRTISALMTSIIATIALLALLAAIVSGPEIFWSSEYSIVCLCWILGGLSFLVFLNVSYQTFVRGETLRTSVRFRVAILSLFQSFMTAAVASIAAYIWIVS